MVEEKKLLLLKRELSAERSTMFYATSYNSFLPYMD